MLRAEGSLAVGNYIEDNLFVLVSEWSVGLLLLTAAERSQEPTQAPCS